MFLNKKVAEALGHKPVSGSVGVEIEVEGRVSDTHTPKEWRMETDGSLKGQGSREFVLRLPSSPESAKKAVHSLYKAMDKRAISNSMRAGVHIHINCQDMTVKQVFTLLSLYYVFENIINLRFGADRQGNLFCLRLTDADFVNTVIERTLTSSSLTYLGGDNIRYCACNLTALLKFGTLEFRAMQTPNTPEPICEWIDLLLTLKEASKEFESPEAVLSQLSADGWDTLAKRVFGPFAGEILKSPGAAESVEEGIRAIQYWVYTTNWKEK